MSKIKKFKESGLIGLEFKYIVEIQERDLLDLIHWSRRYCDSRSTYAPTVFNQVYERIIQNYPEIIQKDQFDHTLYNKGEFWPYCQDGMYNKETGSYDAMPKNIKR